MYRLIIYLFLVSFFYSCNKNYQKEEATTKSLSLCLAPMASLEGVDKLPTPKFRLGIGNSHFAISTDNKEAQRWFDQGLNHLHGFWHLEAYRAFQQVIRLDSSCAMGYWGLSMCQPGFGGSSSIWQNAINKAKALTNTTVVEKALINASEVLIKQGIGAAQEPFRNLYKKFSNEPEIIAFSSIILRQHEDETTQQEVKKLLEDASKRFPENIALMHYYIHVMELRPEFLNAEGIAKQMTKIAPNAPHLQHMPGHLYYLAGNYAKALEVYEIARKIETEYHTQEKIPHISNQNYIHNLQFIAVTQAEMNYETALKTANQLESIGLKSEIKNTGATLMYDYEIRILPALVHIRFQEWDNAVAHFDKVLNSLDRPINNSIVNKYFQVMRLYALAMKAIQQKQVEQATAYGGELSQLMQQYEQEGASRQATEEFKSINETYDIMSMARYELAGWIDNIDPTQPFNESAWKEAINLQNLIKYDEPPRLMYPIEESLARLRKYRGENAEKQKAVLLALKRRPNSSVIRKI